MSDEEEKTMDHDYRAAETAYEAYRADTDGKSLVSGQPIPEWDKLSSPIKKAWGAAADAVILYCIVHFPEGTS